MNKKLFLILALLPLSACGQDYERYNDPTMNYVAPEINNSVDQIIQEESRQAVSSQRMLAMIQRTRTPPTVVPNPNEGAPPELLTNITELNWAGPVDGLLSDIADKIGYRYIKPAVSLGYDTPIVNLDIKNQSIATALDGISLQIQQTTQIVVNPDDKTITLRPNGEPKESIATPVIHKKMPSRIHKIHHVNKAHS